MNSEMSFLVTACNADEPNETKITIIQFDNGGKTLKFHPESGFAAHDILSILLGEFKNEEGEKQ